MSNQLAPTVHLDGIDKLDERRVLVRFVFQPTGSEVSIGVDLARHVEEEYLVVQTAWTLLSELLREWHKDALQKSNESLGDLRDQADWRSLYPLSRTITDPRVIWYMIPQ